MSPVSSFTFATTLSALLTPMIATVTAAIAISTVVIAYRQWRTAQIRIRLDLFDRRMTIYDAVCELLASSGTTDDDGWRRFLVATDKAKWLFSQEIHEYFVNHLLSKLSALQALVKRLPSLTEDKQRAANTDKQAEIKIWFLDQQKVLDEKVGKFLKMPT